MTSNAIINCSYFNPKRPTGGTPTLDSQIFNYASSTCTVTNTGTTTSATSSSINVVRFENATTLSSTTDITFASFITAGDVAIITFLLLFTILLSFYAMAKGLARIQTYKNYLQYGGGDVELRKDL